MSDFACRLGGLVGSGTSGNHFVQVSVAFEVRATHGINNKKSRTMTSFHKVAVLRTEWEIPEYYDNLSLSRRSAFGIYW